MKKTISALAMIALLFSSFNLLAEDEEDRRRRRRGGSNIGVHLNVAPIARGIYSVNTEFGINKNLSAVFTAAFLNIPFTTTTTTPTSIETTKYHYTGFAITPEVRYYFNPSRKTGLDGWFMGAYVKVRSAATEDDALIQVSNTSTDPWNPNFEIQEYGASTFGVGTGLTGGYMYAHKSGICVGAWTGFGYFFVNNTEYTETPLYDLGELLALDIRSGLTIGYRF